MTFIVIIVQVKNENENNVLSRFSHLFEFTLIRKKKHLKIRCKIEKCTTSHFLFRSLLSMFEPILLVMYVTTIWSFLIFDVDDYDDDDKRLHIEQYSLKFYVHNIKKMKIKI